MEMYDYHVHTSFSGDSTMEAETGIARAIAMGIKEIVFTDHAELNVWRPGDVIIDEIFDIESYFLAMNRLRERYEDKINIKFGMEMGLQREEKDRIKQIIQGNPFDFVIGSSHTMDSVDLYFKKFFENKEKEAAFEGYFNEVLKIVEEIDHYSVYGHLDLISRYAKGVYENVSISNKEMEIICLILKKIIEKGKGIEVNTSGYRYGLNSTNPGIRVLELYKDLGGEIITVGSDAHRVEHIGFRIGETYEVLKEIGFRYITTFDRLEPKFVKL